MAMVRNFVICDKVNVVVAAIMHGTRHCIV